LHGEKRKGEREIEHEGGKEGRREGGRVRESMLTTRIFHTHSVPIQKRDSDGL
jgi:hypothetical protein